MASDECIPDVFPPPFASAWGDDAYGLWATLEVTTNNETLGQRLRWIEPGSFVMGSPEDEPGRYPSEGPQHRVMLSHGFWLADTVCTQALWAAVMAASAKTASDTTLPMASVSWLDTLVFLERVSQILGDCEALLPNEAQWEYACRAGTTTAFNVGDSINEENARFDHHPVRYGLGRPSRQLEEGHPFAMPLPVKSFPPNAWGLYEMHGNVWEWCADGLRRYIAQPAVDPVGPMDDPSTPRVTRGGSWQREARGIRSADRVFNPTDLRRRDIGFRFILRPRV